MSLAMHPGLPRLLLLEPQFLVRRMVASVAREMRLADVSEALSLDAAAKLIGDRPFDALLFDLGDDDSVLDLLADVRAGNSKSDRAVAGAVIAGTCSAERVARLKQLEVRRVLLKPFKVRTVLETISLLVGRPHPRG